MSIKVATYRRYLRAGKNEAKALVKAQQMIDMGYTEATVDALFLEEPHYSNGAATPEALDTPLAFTKEGQRVARVFAELSRNRSAE